MSELVAYSPIPAIVKAVRGNYVVATGRGDVELKRNVHFGKIPGTDKPSLYKAGAERVIFGYGFLARYEVESSIEDLEKGFFFYRVKCRLVATREGSELTVSEGFGSANTRERRNGNNSGFDAANNALKMAKKRAMVDAAIMVGQLSDMFTQDIEDDKFMEVGAPKKTEPNDPITQAQRKRIFAIAGNNGLSTEETRNLLISKGFAKTSDIKQKDYDALCEALEKVGKADGN